jgi:predicted DNA-binding protein with PD1-like motif
MQTLGWRCAAILAAFGSLREITIRNPGDAAIPPALLKRRIAGPAEVISFTGHVEEGLQSTVFTRENWYFHVHIGLADRGGRVCGGGFEAGTVHISFRLFIEETRASEESEAVL